MLPQLRLKLQRLEALTDQVASLSKTSRCLDPRVQFDPGHFVNSYCKIYDPGKGETGGDWLPFSLWPMQRSALDHLHTSRLSVWLKARQLGMTWLSLAYALWLLIFRPGCTVLLFSRRDTEAKDLLKRIKGMGRNLPEWLRPVSAQENTESWELTNGSRCLCFPTTAGDSYTASLAVVDEADLVPDLDRLLSSVKPTIDAGGKLLLLSRVDKAKPQSTFKRVYRSAVSGLSEWVPLFLPWAARPDRTVEWYEAQKADSLARTGTLDALWEQYPTTDLEALAPASLDKLLPADLLGQCFYECQDVRHDGPAIRSLKVFSVPHPLGRYVLGIDPAEGNPTSDDSALCVLSQDTGEQVAEVAGKFAPDVIGGYADKLAGWYNDAPLMPERNNHGHALILWLRDNTKRTILKGHDGKAGWLSSSKGKTLLYDGLAEKVRERAVRVCSRRCLDQLSSIEGKTLRAPEGEMDDLADSFALAVAGANQTPRLTYAQQKGNHVRRTR